MKNRMFVLIFILMLGLANGLPALRADDIPAVPAPEESAAPEPEATETPAAEPTETAVPSVPAVEASIAPVVEEAGKAVDASPAASEVAKAIESAAPVEEKKASIFDKYPPQVKLSQWGAEIRINVIPDPQMGAEALAAVQSVKLETEKGEYLGLKTFQAEEKSREAEFMINPEILKIDAVKITVSGKSGDQWSQVQPLKDEKGEGPEAGKAEAPKPAEVAVQPKKKGWLW